MKKFIARFTLGIFCLAACGCATVPGESFWEKGERNTFLACHTVPVIGCLPNLFFNVEKLGEKALKSKDETEGTQAVNDAVSPQEEPAKQPEDRKSEPPEAK